jgi:membrane protein implicated in regulation of membrane protease activity
MITCPWCGTSYAVFQSNCRNCGGPLPAPADSAAPLSPLELAAPPPAPRSIADSYLWRLLGSDGWAVAAGIFTLIGAIFSFVGLILTFAIITAFVGIPFAILGLIFLGLGMTTLRRRYQDSQKTVEVLRQGEAVRGQVINVEANYNVTVNGRNPWTITYQFQLAGREFQNKVTTLNPPGPQLRTGQPVYVLYLPDSPEYNTLYPHP